jgi:hypothetical protein
MNRSIVNNSPRENRRPELRGQPLGILQEEAEIAEIRKIRRHLPSLAETDPITPRRRSAFRSGRSRVRRARKQFPGRQTER